MTPEERERLASQLTVITAPRPPAPLKALPEKAGDATETSPVPSQAPRRWRGLPRRLHGMRLGVFIAMVCVALLGTGLVEGLSPQALHFGGEVLGLIPAPPSPTPIPTQPPSDSIAQKPTISLLEVVRVLQSVNSPILPYAGDVYSDGIQNGIDPVFALAFWMKESREASDGSVAAPDHNPGYTEGLGSDTRCGRWACWPTWPDGIEGWYNYMRVYFIEGRGLTTVESILPIYAPSTENNTSGYIAFVLNEAALWRAQSAADG